MELQTNKSQSDLKIIENSSDADDDQPKVKIQRKSIKDIFQKNNTELNSSKTTMGPMIVTQELPSYLHNDESELEISSINYTANDDKETIEAMSS